MVSFKFRDTGENSHDHFASVSCRISQGSESDETSRQPHGLLPWFAIGPGWIALSGRVSRRRSCRCFEFDRACAEIAVAPDCCRRPFSGRSFCNRLSPALEAVDQGSAQESRRGRTRFSYLNISIFAKVLAKGLTFARHFCEAVSRRKTLVRKIARKSYNFCDRFHPN
jgi:hypothetical protein